MPTSPPTEHSPSGCAKPWRKPEEVVTAVRRYFEGRDRLRRGICLMNAGRYPEAASELTAASGANPQSRPLPAYLAAAIAGPADPAPIATRAAPMEDDEIPSRVREALSRWATGDGSGAVLALRDAVRSHPESAELHFQLGTLLAATDQTEEAELRFTQAIVLNPGHVDAMVGLAMCEGARGATRNALRHLERAQHLSPGDARVNLLLVLAARAAGERGEAIRVFARMPDPQTGDVAAIEELSRVIEAEPDFVDAFLSLPAGEVDEEVFGTLLATLQQALRRQPEYADLCYHCGQVLDRLGRREEAIAQVERAVRLAPKCVKALVALARLYRQTDRLDDAATRLEQALASGAEYADAYLLLGNLYRDKGQLDRARWAYGKALRINERYEDARQALEALPG